MTATMMFSALSVNAGAVSVQPEIDISTTGAVYYNENTSTDVDLISSRILNPGKHDHSDYTGYAGINLNVGAKVYLGNIFKLADGYDFDDFTYECTNSSGDDTDAIKIVKLSGKYYVKAVKEGSYKEIRVFYKKKLIAIARVNVNNDYKSASKLTVSTKTPKIGQGITLKALTSSKEYANCCWIVVGDSSWELPVAWYVNWNYDEVKRGQISLSFNDFGKVKIYCLSPNGKLEKVKINISEEVYDTSINYPDKTWFYDKYYPNINGEYGKAVGYVKPDGTVVFTVECYKDGNNIEYYKDYFHWKSMDDVTYSWEKKEFYVLWNKGNSHEGLYEWGTSRFDFELS